jgi:hypothetical protein
MWQYNSTRLTCLRRVAPLQNWDKQKSGKVRKEKHNKQGDEGKIQNSGLSLSGCHDDERASRVGVPIVPHTQHSSESPYLLEP